MGIKGINREYSNVDCYTGNIRKPYEVYDAEGNLEGYSWHYGDSINLRFELYGEIMVDGKSIVYSVSGQEPHSDVVGYINQKCINIADEISWTCTQISGCTYTWTRDTSYTEPTSGDIDTYITANDMLKGKSIEVSILNLNRKIIDSRIFKGSSVIEYIIDKDLSKKLVCGTYYVVMNLIDTLNVLSVEILGGRDCRLIVKE